MNLVEQLLKADAKKAEEFESGVFRSQRLVKILGAKCPFVEVTIKEVGSRLVNDIVAYQVDKKGQLDFSKTYDAKLMMVVEGVVDPDLRNKDLQKYFGCTNAKDLAEKLFGNEINELSDAISALSGVSATEDNEEEVKN